MKKPSPKLEKPTSGVKLKTGQKAPFDGVLMHPKALAKLITTLEARAKRAEASLKSSNAESLAKVKAAVSISETRAAELTKRIQSCDADRIRRDAIYEKALSRCSNKSWYRSPTLWTAIGTTLGAAACGLAVGVGR